MTAQSNRETLHGLARDPGYEAEVLVEMKDGEPCELRSRGDDQGKLISQ